jgi:hypothetical protein
MLRSALLVLALLLAVSEGHTIHRSNVEPTLDSSHSIINAHETQIVQWKTGGVFYMYAMKYALCHAGPTHGAGCSSNRSDCDFRDDHNVSVFTSVNLTSGSWEWQADIFPAAAPTSAYFRGKVMHNPALGTFVLWIFGGKNLVVAVASSATGPFKLHSVTPSNQALLHKTG